MARIELPWNPFDPADPGPCITVSITNSKDVIEAGRALGFEYPDPRPMRALLDTGSSITVISRVFANTCKLFQTGDRTEVTSLGAVQQCTEHAGCISFPGTPLRAFDPAKIVSALFKRERFYAIIIGRDIMRNWVVIFDAPSRRVIITD